MHQSKKLKEELPVGSELTTVQLCESEATASKLSSSSSKTQSVIKANMLASQFKPRHAIGNSAGTMVLPDWIPENPIHPDLFQPETIHQYQQQYTGSIPYKHVQFQQLCSGDAMKRIQQEILENLPTTERETDLFKVNQTIDLNNIPIDSQLAKQIPTLISLRNHIYSPEFRQMLQQVTGCQELSDRVDCAANVYSGVHGNHLLCHDDVITTRMLSYIIYLPLIDDNTEDDDESNDSNTTTSSNTTNGNTTTNSPSDGWDINYGGCLELFDKISAPILPHKAYPTAQQDLRQQHEEKDTDPLAVREVAIPLSIPSKQVLPRFNSLCVFEVKSGESFHAVQEVYNQHTKRISIQGWFHQQQHCPDYGATLRLLQTRITPPQPLIASSEAVSSGESTSISSNETTDSNERDILSLALSHGVKDLTKEEVSLLAQNQLPNIDYEPFTIFNANHATELLTHITDSTANKATHDGLSEEDHTNIEVDDIDYLSQIVILHLRNILYKLHQRAVEYKHVAQHNSPVGSATAEATAGSLSDDAAQSDAPSSSSPDHTMSDQHPVENDADDDDIDDDTSTLDIYAPEIIKEDLKWLRRYISPQYTSIGVLKQLQDQWDDDGIVQLGHFLKPEIIESVLKCLIRTDVVDGLALCPNLEDNADQQPEDHQEMSDEEAEDEDEDEDEDDDEDDDDEDEDESEENHLITTYTSKTPPPGYLVGLSPLSQQIALLCGAWKLAGPAYLRRFAYFQSPVTDNTIYHPNISATATDEHHPSPSPQKETLSTIRLETVLATFNQLSIHIKTGLVVESLLLFVFGSLAFTRLIEWITQQRILSHRSTIRRLRSGLDYTVGNYSEMIDGCDQDILAQHIQQISSDDEMTSTPACLRVMDIVFSMCDDGAFDHHNAKNIWTVHKEESEMKSDTNTALQLDPSSKTPLVLRNLYPNIECDEMRQTNIDDEDEDDDDEEDQDKKHPSQQKKSERWSMDDCGGFLAYVPTDKTTEGDDAEAYVESTHGHDDNEPQLLSLSLTNNTLTLCKRRENVLSFVRYINYHAPGSRWDIFMNACYQEHDLNEE